VACWSSNAWIKEPGVHEIPWHQDFLYWPLEPALNDTAWIAIEAADRANGCVNIIQLSHGTNLPQVRHEGAGYSTIGSDSRHEIWITCSSTISAVSSLTCKSPFERTVPSMMVCGGPISRCLRSSDLTRGCGRLISLKYLSL
jgi:hypothetical protein